MVKRLREIGVEGMEELATPMFGGQTLGEYRADLHWPGVYDVYDEMRRRDPTLRSIVHVTKLLAKTARWKAEPATDRPADREAAEFLESCLEGMSHTVSDWIDDAFTALPFGWASSEIVYQRREDGRIGWRKLAFRRQSSWDGWLYDDAGGFQGWWQRAAPRYQRVRLPSEKLIHTVFERDGGRPEGMSIFESAYEAWHYVTNLQLISGIGWQRSFVGLPVFEFEQVPSDDDSGAVREIGQGLRVGARQYISVPPGIKFRLEASQNSGAGALLDEIKYFRALIAQIVLADFIMLGMDGGSYAIGSDKSMIFMMIVDGLLDRVSEAWNRFGVRRLFELNSFPGMTAAPHLTHSAIRKVRLGDIGAFVQQIGPWMPLTETDVAWVREQVGIPIPPPGTPVIERSGQVPAEGGGQWRYPEEREAVGAGSLSEGALPPTGSPLRGDYGKGSLRDGPAVSAAQDALQARVAEYFAGLTERVASALEEDVDGAAGVGGERG